MAFSHYFYNPNLSVATNSMIWWTWESIIHHMYFIVLFVQRQFSEKWETGELWRVNMEKECEFFAQFFGGDSKFCAEASISIFAGLWFRNPNPTPKQLNWIGRLIANYQHCEAFIHFLIVIFGLAIVLRLAKQKKDLGAYAVPGFIRWAFFAALFFETWTMCVPYLFLFAWGWMPFIESPKSGLAAYIESLGNEDGFLDGIQFGAALITMFWVSVVVLILDATAMFKSWYFAMGGKPNLVLTFLIFGGTTAFFVHLLSDLFKEDGRGKSLGEFSLAEAVCDTLHSLFGDNHVPMATLVNDA